MIKRVCLGLLMASFIMCGGCMSTYKETTTIKEFDATGKVIVKETVTEKEGEKTPFLDKWVNIFGWGYGFKIVMFDPQTGSYAPCIEAIGGRTGMQTMPVAGENSNTYCEKLYIEKSMWSNAASVVEYDRVASGSTKELTPAITIELELKPNVATGESILDGLTGLAPSKIIKPATSK